MKMKNRTNPFTFAHIPARAKGPKKGEPVEWASQSIRQIAPFLVAGVNPVEKGICLPRQFRVERAKRGRTTGAIL